MKQAEDAKAKCASMEKKVKRAESVMALVERQEIVIAELKVGAYRVRGGEVVLQNWNSCLAQWRAGQAHGNGTWEACSSSSGAPG